MIKKLTYSIFFLSSTNFSNHFSINNFKISENSVKFIGGVMQLKRGSVRGEGKGNLSTRLEISNLFKYKILRLDSLVKELVYE